MRESEMDLVKGLAIVGVLIAHISFEKRFGENTMLLVDTLKLVFGWRVIRSLADLRIP
jgi:fucose 4-O-acetylase-like acetyltransferase